MIVQRRSDRRRRGAQGRPDRRDRGRRPRARRGWPSRRRSCRRSGRSRRSATSTTRSRRCAASPRCSPSSASRWRGRARGFRAPENCIKAVEAAVEPAVRPGPEARARAVPGADHLARVQGPALLLLRGARGGQDPRRAGGHRAATIKKAAVLGAGTMGGGIAMNFANAGIPVTVVEVAQDALDRGLGVVRKNYEATASRGPAHQAGRREAHGPDLRHDRLDARSRTPTSWSRRSSRRCRSRRRSSRKIDKHLQAGRGARLQHLHARRGRDRLRDDAAGRA